MRPAAITLELGGQQLDAYFQKLLQNDPVLVAEFGSAELITIEFARWLKEQTNVCQVMENPNWRASATKMPRVSVTYQGRKVYLLINRSTRLEMLGLRWRSRCSIHSC